MVNKREPNVTERATTTKKKKSERMLTNDRPATGMKDGQATTIDAPPKSSSHVVAAILGTARKVQPDDEHDHEQNDVHDHQQRRQRVDQPGAACLERPQSTPFNHARQPSRPHTHNTGYTKGNEASSRTAAVIVIVHQLTASTKASAQQ
uniref:Uncharacterized protein n=1 Tax=Plectus sambesii TaxID=2011161 RepID=A0A914VX75_9BILA